MRDDCSAVLDSCVLLPMPLADTLLRMAEEPRLYVPRWSDGIMEEVSRNLVSKFGRTPEQAAYREAQIQKAFPSAGIHRSYKSLIEAMPGDEKDRHVVAAAVHSNAELIVTYNKKHFPARELAEYGIAVKGPSAFLRDLFDLEPAIATRKLAEQAAALHMDLADLLVKMRVLIPGFVTHFAAELSLDLPPAK